MSELRLREPEHLTFTPKRVAGECRGIALEEHRGGTGEEAELLAVLAACVDDVMQAFVELAPLE